jgi:2-keto-4-pentenoate hydratase
MLAAGARLLGWKIAASIPGVRPDDGVGGLIFGYLTSDTAMNAGGSFRPDTTVQLCAEVELAVVIGRDVEPDTDLEMAVDAVIGLAVALEIVDVDETSAWIRRWPATSSTGLSPSARCLRRRRGSR